MLEKKGFLESEVREAERTHKKTRWYRRAATWPPPAKFFDIEPIGLPYYVGEWFRYYLKVYIEI